MTYSLRVLRRCAAASLALLLIPSVAGAVCRVIEPSTGEDTVEFDPTTTVLVVQAPEQVVEWVCPVERILERWDEDETDDLDEDFIGRDNGEKEEMAEPIDPSICWDGSAAPRGSLAQPRRDHPARGGRSRPADRRGDLRHQLEGRLARHLLTVLITDTDDHADMKRHHTKHFGAGYWNDRQRGSAVATTVDELVNSSDSVHVFPLGRIHTTAVVSLSSVLHARND